MKPSKIAYIPMKYPVLSQTFIQREVLGLRSHGLHLLVMPCLTFGKGEEGLLQLSWKDLLQLPFALWREGVKQPCILWKGLRLLCWYPPQNIESWFFAIWGACYGILRSEKIREEGIEHVHATWATAPATAAAVIARICNIPFSFGAHAYDIYRHGGDNFLEPKCKGAKFVHTTTQTNIDYLSSRFPIVKKKLVLARRGIPLLPELKDSVKRKHHEEGMKEIRLISVGRLVEKKGHVFQIAACAELKKRGFSFQLRIVGNGPLEETLQAAIQENGLKEEIELCGALPQREVNRLYEWADLFWHTGVVDSEGDRDGLPNVIPEAFSFELPVICGLEKGAREAIESGINGEIVDITDAVALADTVVRLSEDYPLRQQMGKAGRKWVEDHFLTEKNTKILSEAF